MRQKSHGIEIEIHRNILLDNPRRDLHIGYHTLVAPQVENTKLFDQLFL